jgi:hypothetical protein
MGKMLTRNTLHQPTLTQMDFVQPLTKKRPPLPLGWQSNTCEAMGNALYMASGRIVFKFDNMLAKNGTDKPSQALSAPVELFPNNPVSGANIFATPHCFKDGST